MLPEHWRCKVLLPITAVCVELQGPELPPPVLVLTVSETEAGVTATAELYPAVLVVQVGVKVNVPADVGVLNVNVLAAAPGVAVKPLVGLSVQVTVAAAVLLAMLIVGAAAPEL